MAMSVSRTKLVMELKQKGRCECELARHLAPLTVGTILRSVPLEGRAYHLEDMLVYFETGLNIGTEKQRSSFKKGEMGFMISNGSICIFKRDVSSASNMNPIGKILTNVELIEGCEPGNVLHLRKV